MNHYDGPAYYRRFLKKSNQPDTPIAYSNNKMTNSRQLNSVHRADVSSPDISNFRTAGRNSIMELTDQFKPKGNYAHRVSGDSYLNESKLGRYYMQLLNQLDKPSADCILMDATSTPQSSADLIQFDSPAEAPLTSAVVDSSYQPAFVSAQSEAPVSPQRTAVQEPQPSAKHFAQPSATPRSLDRDAEQSTVPTNAHRELERPLKQREGEPSAAIDSASSASATGQSAEPEQRTASQAPHSSSAPVIDSKSSSHDSTNQQSATPKPKRGLGHSLTDILGNEQDAQKDVAYFNDDGGKDEPATDSQAGESLAQPDTESAAESEHLPLSAGDEYEHGYQFPRFELLNEPQRNDDADLDDWIIKQSEILERTLHAFHVQAEVVDWTNGPTVTQFQVKLALGVKVSKITNLNDDLKMALAAKDIRIEAPIPGRTTVGVEIPNPKPRPVMLAEVLDSDAFQSAKSPLTIALGVDLTGKPQVTDISKMPHGLIAGATGSGKSVFINSLLVSLLYKATPAQLRLLLIDPKAVELAPYNNLPHLLAPVISEPNEASAALKWAVKEMDERYEKLAAGGARNIEQFNQKAEESNQPQLKMPYIVIIIDELADLMMVASTEVQDYIVRITQKARAAGIHLIVATQRPSVDIVTGTIKNNIPTRIAFMVSSQVDSRTIIDSAGAERLLGRGDMLYLGNGKSQPLRIQGTFVSNEEIERITAKVRTQGQPKYAFNPKLLLKKVNMVQQQDELLPEVLKYIAGENAVSTSKLQRVFSIGYNRAASLIDDLEQQNYISGQHGSKPREVYLTEDDFKKLNL